MMIPRQELNVSSVPSGSFNDISFKKEMNNNNEISFSNTNSEMVIQDNQKNEEVHQEQINYHFKKAVNVESRNKSESNFFGDLVNNNKNNNNEQSSSLFTINDDLIKSNQTSKTSKERTITAITTCRAT